MFEFATYEGAMACFSQVGYVGQNNCVFFATSIITGGGFVGGMQQAQSDSVYIVRTCGDGADLNISSLLEKAVARRNPESRIYAGSPLTSVDEMQNLTQQKAALLLVHNKRTVQADVEKVLDLCSRQAIKVLGAVAITDI